MSNAVPAGCGSTDVSVRESVVCLGHTPTSDEQHQLSSGHAVRPCTGNNQAVNIFVRSVGLSAGGLSHAVSLDGKINPIEFYPVGVCPQSVCVLSPRLVVCPEADGVCNRLFSAASATRRATAAAAALTTTAMTTLAAKSMPGIKASIAYGRQSLSATRDFSDRSRFATVLWHRIRQHGISDSAARPCLVQMTLCCLLRGNHCPSAAVRYRYL